MFRTKKKDNQDDIINANANANANTSGSNQIPVNVGGIVNICIGGVPNANNSSPSNNNAVNTGISNTNTNTRPFQDDIDAKNLRAYIANENATVTSSTIMASPNGNAGNINTMSSSFTAFSNVVNANADHFTSEASSNNTNTTDASTSLRKKGITKINISKSKLLRNNTSHPNNNNNNNSNNSNNNNNNNNNNNAIKEHKKKKYHIRDPSDPNAAGDLVAMITPIRQPVMMMDNAGKNTTTTNNNTNNNNNYNPNDHLTNECLVALRVKSFEFSGNNVLSSTTTTSAENHHHHHHATTTTGDLTYGHIRKNMNHMNPKSKNKFRYICITRSTNKTLMKRRKKNHVFVDHHRHGGHNNHGHYEMMMDDDNNNNNDDDDTNSDRQYKIPKNLVIWTNTTVHKVLFDSHKGTHYFSKPKAIGVKYTSSSDSGTNKKVRQVLLRNKESLRGSSNRPSEIILAAGAILTPQILSNSGIRKGGYISNLNEIGKNVQDHPVVAVTFEQKNILQKDVLEFFKSDEDDDDNDNDDTKSSEYNLGANALLGSPGFSAGAFLSSPWSNDEPDIQLTVFPQEREPHYTHRLKSQNVTNSAVMLITVALLRPEGRYEIKLADPVYDDSLHDNGSSSIDKYFEQLYKFKVPSIVPTNDNSTYLTDVDAKRIAWGIEQVRNITRFSPLSNRINDEVLPGSHINGADLIEFVKDSIMTNSHWCGSTRMGMDSNSVVDEFLRVRGVLNLRIVDAGVFPFIPNGNTHSTTCVVALRAVDLILGSQS